MKRKIKKEKFAVSKKALLKLNSKLTIGFVLLLQFGIVGQNTSYNVNNNPISGTDNSAFGYNALSGVSGTGNAGFGKGSLSSSPSGNYNAAFGTNSMLSNTSGYYNSALGASALGLNTTGYFNSAVGTLALYNNTSGHENVANGYYSLQANTTGYYNTGNGVQSLYSNSTGYGNVATGWHCLYNNNTGFYNMASGTNAMFSNTSGYDNTANGTLSMFSNTNGYYNSALGVNSLYSNTSGYNNVAIGNDAMNSNTTGYKNVALGTSALFSNVSGLFNSAVGNGALVSSTADKNTGVGDSVLAATTSGYANSAIGYSALQTNITGYENSAIGTQADVSTTGLNNATAIGAYAVVNATQKIKIGGASVTVIEGQVAYTQTSDQRFKENVSEKDVVGLAFIKKLRPVVYNFNTKKYQEFITKEMSDDLKLKFLSQDFSASTKIRQSGFLAQEVEKAAQEVGYNFNGIHKPDNDNDHYSLAYSQFVVPLVKAVQEQQTQIEMDSKSITELNKKVENQQKQIDELKTLIGVNLNSPVQGTTTSINTVMISDKDLIVLNQNVPNPFAESTVISYNIPYDFNVNKVQIIFTTIEGKVIKSIDITTKGKGQLNVFANDLSSGIYSYSLVVDGNTIETKKLIKQ